MNKKGMIVLGSPRKNGNSQILANRVAQGILDNKGEVDTIYLHGMNIKPCMACNACRNGKSNCIIEDDMKSIYSKILKADFLVFASPIYWFSVSAQMKLFIDRLYALKKGDNYLLANKPVGIVLTYGGDDPYDSGAVNAINSFKDMFNYIGAPVVGVVYGQAINVGEIVKRVDVMEKAYDLGVSILKYRA